MLNTTNTFTFPLANHHTSSIFAVMICSCCHKSESYFPFEHIWLWPCVEVYYPLLIEYKCIPEHRFPSIRLCLYAWYYFLEHLNIALRRSCWVYNWVLKKIFKNWFKKKMLLVAFFSCWTIVSCTGLLKIIYNRGNLYTASRQGFAQWLSSLLAHHIKLDGSDDNQKQIKENLAKI